VLWRIVLWCGLPNSNVFDSGRADSLAANLDPACPAVSCLLGLRSSVGKSSSKDRVGEALREGLLLGPGEDLQEPGKLWRGLTSRLPSRLPSMILDVPRLPLGRRSLCLLELGLREPLGEFLPLAVPPRSLLCLRSGLGLRSKLELRLLSLRGVPGADDKSLEEDLGLLHLASSTLRLRGLPESFVLRFRGLASSLSMGSCSGEGSAGG